MRPQAIAPCHVDLPANYPLEIGRNSRIGQEVARHFGCKIHEQVDVTIQTTLLPDHGTENRDMEKPVPAEVGFVRAQAIENRFEQCHGVKVTSG